MHAANFQCCSKQVSDQKGIPKCSMGKSSAVFHRITLSYSRERMICCPDSSKIKAAWGRNPPLQTVSRLLQPPVGHPRARFTLSASLLYTYLLSLQTMADTACEADSSNSSQRHLPPKYRVPNEDPFGPSILWQCDNIIPK